MRTHAVYLTVMRLYNMQLLELNVLLMRRQAEDPQVPLLIPQEQTLEGLLIAEGGDGV
jgi:hypothetical protein